MTYRIIRAIPRTVTTFYTAAYDESGREVERDIIISVSPDGLRNVTIDTDLSDLPPAEVAGVVERATDLYWAAEREAYEAAAHDR